METTAPTYLEALKKSEAYSDSPQKIKFEETQGSYLFHADAQLYKIKKTGNEFASLAVKEVFCREECRLLMHYNPEWTAEVYEEVIRCYRILGLKVLEKSNFIKNVFRN